MTTDKKNPLKPGSKDNKQTNKEQTMNFHPEILWGPVQ